MQSLRARLVSGLSLGIALVLTVTAVMAYSSIARVLRDEFDAALADRARSLSTLVEEDESGVSFELAELPAPESPEDRARQQVFEGDDLYQLWRADGSVLARCLALGDESLSHQRVEMNQPCFDTRTSGGGAYRFVTFQFEPRRESELSPAGRSAPVTIVVRRPLARLSSTLTGVRNLLGGAALAGALLAAALVAWTVRWTLRPVSTLGEQISAIGADEMSARVRVPALPRELQPVAERLNELLSRLEAAFERERRFTADVAHELRTPLAGLRAKLELALARDREPAAYRAALTDCLEINRRTEGVVENLLALARADAGQLELQRKSVDLGRLLEERWREFAPGVITRNVSVVWSTSPLPLVETDVEKLGLIIRNLFENAAAYVDDGGRIVVNASLVDRQVSLRVTNTGCRLSTNELPMAGRRFWRGESLPSQRNGTAHCGLGLALCGAIAAALGGSLTLRQPAAGLFEADLRTPQA